MDWPNHKAPWREWHDAMSSDRMHHSWILAGKGGLGKSEFAMSAARELVSEPGIPQPEGDHPDIINLTHLPKDEKEEKKRQDGKPYQVKRNISVAQIRAMQQRLVTRPTLGARRAIIINPADDMEKSASNALLKSLEEPPQGTFFILISHKPSRLLPTIRSRCRILRFEELSDDQIRSMLQSSGASTDNVSTSAAIAVAGGSFGSAASFLSQDLGQIAMLMSRIVGEGDSTLSLHGQLTKAVGARPDRDKMQSILDLARMVVAQEAECANGSKQSQLIETHCALVELTSQAPTYNFDAGMLIVEIGSLLARAAEASEPANG